MADAGEDPVPRKLVIAYKTEDEVPQYAVTIRKWNLEADVPDELFHFEPPEGARRVEIPAFVGAGLPDAVPADSAPDEDPTKPEATPEVKP